MLIAFILIVIHYIADFMAQTEEMALGKSKSFKILVKHTWNYTFIFFVFFGFWSLNEFVGGYADKKSKNMKIEVSNGEIADKLSIIEIKLEKITDEDKLVNLRKEYIVLNVAMWRILDKKHPLYKELVEINKKLWVIEDEIRNLESAGIFDQQFIELARSVYFTNDKRSEIKRQINDLTGSKLVEEKSYKSYEKKL